MKQYLLKSSLMLTLLCLVSFVSVGQTDIEVRLANATTSGGSCPDGSPDQFCATLQIKGAADFQIGYSGIWLEYKMAAIDNPVITSLNFNSGVYTTPESSVFETNTRLEGIGEINYLVTTFAGPEPGAPTIPAEVWTDVFMACWDVVNANQTTGIEFYYESPGGDPFATSFNNADPNDGTNQHNITATMDLDISIECPTDIIIETQVLLEGAYSGGTMRTDLVGANVVPTAQPYNTAPWNYGGAEQVVGAIPANVVDWVLLSVTTDGTTAGIVQTVAGLLLADGNIVNAAVPSVSGVVFAGLAAGNYQVIIRHRNHLDIVSANVEAIAAGGTGVFDLTNDAQVIGEFVQLKDMGSGDFVMKAGDANGNSNVNASDNGVWLTQDTDLGYRNGDFNMNANVNASDRGVWLPNDTQVGAPNTAP